MKISDLTCPTCTSVYEVAESSSSVGRPGRVECVNCGQLLDSWQDSKLRAYRLVLSQEYKYHPVPAPSSPMRSMAA
jgi:predicted Zn finger-like uncharacterized protein